MGPFPHKRLGKIDRNRREYKREERKMNCSRSERMVKKDGHRSMLAYWSIIFMHDNPLFNIFKNPEKKLKNSEIKEGKRVLEVGCGPGFYTVPATRMVGKMDIYVMDLHPNLLKGWRKKLKRQGYPI